MAGLKRKSGAKDSAASNQAALFDELGNGPLQAALADSEDGDAEQDELEPASDEDVASGDEEFFGEHVVNGHVYDDLDQEDQGSDVSNEDEDDSILPHHSYTLTTDANGNLRYIYPEIDPSYDSDDSDAPATTNTIGNIPLSFYDSYPHIGYDLDGRRVMRPAKGAALDSLLDSIEIPKGWTGLTDPATGKPLELTDEELDVLKRVSRNELPEDGYDPYPDTIEYFTSKTEQMPLSAAPEPKRRFVPSKHEAVRVMKLVKAIREGRIQPYQPPAEQPDDEELAINYDLWANEAPGANKHHLPAPKLPPPTYDESYHPPLEYVPDDQERKVWQETDEEDREKDYLPTNHDALRKVPAYDRFVKDKFERCLDLYLAPRVRRSKLNIDPESLLPKLPNPEELKPFPTNCSVLCQGHQGRVRSIAYDSSGNLLATGGDDGTVRIWMAESGKLIWTLKLSNKEAVNAVSWRPGKDACILAVAVAESIFLIAPRSDPDYPEFGSTYLEDLFQLSYEMLDAGWVVQKSQSSAQPQGKEAPAKWVKPELRERGALVQIILRSSARVISWHRRGDYFASVSPQGQTSGIAIHTLSKHLTQLPFRKLKGLPQSAKFHPSKPIFFVATQRMIRSYDLARQELLKILQPGARWISSFDVHPAGDNLVVGSFDKRLLWMDMDLAVTPYKTLRYHGKAIRSVKFHQGGHPLFVDASDDGTLQVFHGRVVGDLMENANIVPLKVLKGHRVENGLGVLDVDWHPTEPWCASAGADGVCRLWKP